MNDRINSENSETGKDIMEKDNIVRNSYQGIKLNELSKERILHDIITSDKADKKKIKHTAWRRIAVACAAAALIIPVGSYAAIKISEYYKVSILKESYKAEIHVSQDESASDKMNVKPVKNSRKKYIKFKADFGKEYTTTDTDESKMRFYEIDNEDISKVREKYINIPKGSYGMYYYSHIDGFDAGKDFLINILYVDTDEDAILNLYDQKSMKETVVNGHKAFLCVENGTVNTIYNSNSVTSYAIHLFIFYDEFGYIIDMLGMNGIGTDNMLSLADKIDVSESDWENASRYQYLSKYDLVNGKSLEYASDEDRKYVIHDTHDIVNYHGILYQITDVDISSSMPAVDSNNFIWEDIGLDPEEYIADERGKSPEPFKKESDVWNKDGSLKSYVREIIKSGDGINEPERSVEKKENINLKAVNVTMKVKPDRKTSEDDVDRVQIPAALFLEESGGSYKDASGQNSWYGYNRPKLVDGIFTDNMPCYFKETSGNGEFYEKIIDSDIIKGEEETYHFTYIVDEDMINNMYLEIGREYYDSPERMCIELGIK